MIVYLKCFASPIDSDRCDYIHSTPYEVSEGETLQDLINHLELPASQAAVIVLNGRPAGADTKLKNGDQIALAPVSGRR